MPAICSCSSSSSQISLEFATKTSSIKGGIICSQPAIGVQAVHPHPQHSSSTSSMSRKSTGMASPPPHHGLTSLGCSARLALVLLLFLAASALSAVHGHSFAQGNLFVVFHPRSGRSSEHSPQLANLSSLWCQATSNGLNRLPIKDAKFVRTLPKPEKIQPASRINAANDRAFLDFGLVPLSAIGKYRCEITTRGEEGEEDEQVSGNLFVYMRPVLLFNNTARLDPVEEGNLFAWTGTALKASVGDDAELNCPVIGYPLPQIQWFKDGSPINTSATVEAENGGLERRKYLLTAQKLYIRQVASGDEANYKCMATNAFPLHVDESPREFQLSLEQHLRVTTTLSWLIPLLIIILCLVCLFCIIGGCSKWKQYKSKQYNVAQKERQLGKKGVADGQKAPLEPDDVED